MTPEVPTGATSATSLLLVRDAREADLAAIRAIYNQGIEDRTATLDEDQKSAQDIRAWFGERAGRYVVVVAQRGERVVGWASLNPYSHRCAYRSVADLSVYVERDARGTGVGTALLRKIAARAKSADFHKIVLFALTQNTVGLRLYRSLGYREVGTFREHGRLDGRYVDVVAMERILEPG